MSKRTHRLPGAVIAALTFALPLSVFPASADSRQSVSRYVLSHAVDFLQQALAPEQLASLHLAAYSAAAASACGELDLDDAKFVKHFEKLAHRNEAKLTPEQKVNFERHLMLTYGVTIGAFLAEAGQNPDEFCKDAQEFKQQNQAGTLWK